MISPPWSISGASRGAGRRWKRRLRAYETTLQTWSQRAETYPGPWAAFLKKR